jgi:dipeptidase E
MPANGGNVHSDLLLLSSSTLYGKSYLEHALAAVTAFLDGRRSVHFVAWALADHDGYTARARAALAPLGVSVTGLHAEPDPVRAVAGAEVLFVGGGNTFRLLRALQAAALLPEVRERVAAGELAYLGSSAGTNVACPTIRTTNDMPIVEPAGLAAFGLLPFQVNPHYQDAEPGSTHMGETRAQRISQFLEESDVPVLGLREPAWLRRQGDRLSLGGTAGAVLFRRGVAPVEIEPGKDLSSLLGYRARFDAPDGW